MIKYLKKGDIVSNNDGSSDDREIAIKRLDDKDIYHDQEEFSLGIATPHYNNNYNHWIASGRSFVHLDTLKVSRDNLKDLKKLLNDIDLDSDDPALLAVEED